MGPHQVWKGLKIDSGIFHVYINMEKEYKSINQTFFLPSNCKNSFLPSCHLLSLTFFLHFFSLLCPSFHVHFLCPTSLPSVSFFALPFTFMLFLPVFFAGSIFKTRPL
ncbi:hypothetical protein ATANTOWER_004978 [Ataeniobius toweri]|uniref:Uncharacterized protein n=1 Tax=Ataeniobius toweri TaxID=208326 RepID=A0ABU7AYB3_9TELE|nr:hypothetical protein [Ataeniobius toweri]